LVNYQRDVPHVVWETVLPNLVVGVLSAEEKKRMHAVSKIYSHQGDDEGHFKDDSTLKRGRAPPSIQDAVALFLDPVYEQLEAIRGSQQM